MSLIEPLLPKKEAKDQILEKNSNDPFANIKKSIEKLPSIEFKSYEIDGTSDIEFRHEDSESMIEYCCEELSKKDIRCATTFEYNLVIGRIDGIIKIYDLDTKEERVLKGHSKSVTCLQVTFKKDFLVSGSADKTIIIWKIETYKQERVFKAENEVFCLIVTPGYNLFSGSLDDNLIRKWNFWDENENKALSGHKKGITCMKSFKNNHFLVTGSLDETLKIWNIESSQELKDFKAEKFGEEIRQIEITEDDKYLVVLCMGFIYLWDFNKREMIKKLSCWRRMNINNASKCIMYNSLKRIYYYNIESQTDSKEILIEHIVSDIVCSKKNSLAYYGLDNGNGNKDTVKIINTKSSNNFVEFKDFDNKISKMLLIGNNDEYLASIMKNGKIKIHEICEGNVQKVNQIDYDSPEIKLTRDRKYLIIHNMQSLSIWNYIEQNAAFSNENFKLVMKKEIKNQEFLGVKISYDDKYFIFYDNGAIYIYSFQGMKEAAKFEMDTRYKITCFSISKDNQFILVGNEVGSIAVFDIEKKCKINTLEGLDSYIKILEITETNDYFISVDLKNNLTFWSFLDKKITKSFHFDYSIKFLVLNDKYNCVVFGTDYWTEIWNFQTQAKIAKFPDAGWWKFAEISEDETYLLFTREKGATIWSFEYMKEIESIISPFINFLDITRDNKYILVGENEEYIKLWSCQEKRFIAKIRFSKAHKVKFIEDAKSIIAWNYEGWWIQNIEEYFDCSRADSFLYFCSSKHDKLILQEFITWIKSPSEYSWDNSFLDIVVNPIGYNALHYLCIHDRVDSLSTALKNGGEIFRDNQNMSPLSYALARSSRRCIDEILNYVINIEDEKKQYSCIHQLREDIPLLLNAKSLNLVPFLEVLFRRRADKDHVDFYEVTEELPMSIFSPVSKVYTSAFTGENDIEKKEPAKQSVNLVQFWGSPWGYNYTVGSEESLFLLKKIDDSQNENIFQTLIVQSIIREKWEYLWPAIITISIIYWLNLIAMIWYIFDPNYYILSSFIMLNGILALYELLQFSTQPIDYVTEIWNLVDCTRMALSIIWAIFEFNNENIEVLCLLLCFLTF